MSFLEPFIDFPVYYYFSLGLPEPRLGDIRDQQHSPVPS